MQERAEPSDGQEPISAVERERLLAFHYLAADEAAQYIAVMRVLADDVGGLLSDWSAPEVAEALERSGQVLDVDTVEARLRYLLDRGNLARSPRESEARTIREYLLVRSRYQVTPRGERVHRLVSDVLGDPGGTQEISTELLAPLVAGLDALRTLAQGGGLAAVPPPEVAERIGTVFAQFDRLVESTRTFYAHLAELLQQVDVDRVLFLAYKAALVGYLQNFVEEVRRFAPRAAELLDSLQPHLDDLCARAGTGRGIAGPEVRRSRGLEPADWAGLTVWFAGSSLRRADADRVTDLALAAIRALIATINRLALPSGAEVSRYQDLLRVAGWFAAADDETAHALWASVFGLYPARHLGCAADAALDVPSTASFWFAPPAAVPVSLRERGDRTVPGRAGRRKDFSGAKRRRLAERADGDRRRRLAATELLALTGCSGELALRDETRGLLLELHARALADPSFLTDGVGVAIDSGLGITVTARRAPGIDTQLVSRSGRLVLHDLRLVIESATFNGRLAAAEHARDEDTA